MAAFFIAPALMSISVGAILLLGFTYLVELKNELKTDKLLLIISALFGVLLLFHLSGWVISQDKAEAQRKFLLKLPFLISPLLLIPLKKLNAKQKNTILIVFCFFVYLTGSVSTFIYLRNQPYFDQLILEAKPIPIFFGYGIYHIQFSILNAIAGFLGLIILVKGRVQLFSILGIFLLIVTLVNIANLHILSARTGLVSFYLALGVSFLYFIKGKKLVSFLKWLPMVLLIPLLAYQFSGSLRNRLTNSLEDLKIIRNAEDPNDQSVAMRIEAWKVSFSLIKQQPFLGVGLGDLEPRLQEQYILDKTPLSEFNRKNPHNQLIETATQIGVLGALSLLLIFLLLLLRNKKSVVFAAVIVIWVASMMFESVLERQVSTIAFAFFLFFLDRENLQAE